jgi:hypothetical protein
MISRQNLTASACGLLAGVLGAIVATRFAVRPAQLAASQPSPSTSAGGIVPPGWDPHIVGQIAALERRVGAAEGALASQRAPEPSAAPKAPEPARGIPGRGAEWEQKRLEHYQQELATQATLVARHESEPVDAAWSKPLADSIQNGISLGGTERAFNVKGVDCRSKTCVATLTFPTPAEALGFLARSDPRLMAKGCNGFTATPQPPSGEGQYDLSIVYTCR